MNAPAMKRLSAGLRLLVLLAAACLTLVLPAVAADEVTAPPGDTGEQLKSKTEQMNDSFSSLVDTIAADDSDTFSPAQKKHLQGLRDQAKNETARTPPQEFKHQSRNRRVDCVIRERLGDVDDKGKPLGNEDGRATAWKWPPAAAPRCSTTASATMTASARARANSTRPAWKTAMWT